ncbi:hypothetical protein EZU83_19745 [Escherichia coli]|nr:hypothetical protein [Escherichia coli]EFD7671063.1 hypothetical protein [Escherichia coli]EFF6174294.1 hypothetical protein [Escherichia coli]EGD6058653.1 hypothetical protein [Escherichia coli]NNQ37633.1 hypothetical protein [Escherichia coli]
MACEKAAESLHHAERNCTQQTDTSLSDEGGERLRPGRIAVPDNSVLYLPVTPKLSPLALPVTENLR